MYLLMPGNSCGNCNKLFCRLVRGHSCVWMERQVNWAHLHYPWLCSGLCMSPSICPVAMHLLPGLSPLCCPCLAWWLMSVRNQCCNIPFWITSFIIKTKGRHYNTPPETFRESSDLSKVMIDLWPLKLLLGSGYCFWEVACLVSA